MVTSSIKQGRGKLLRSERHREGWLSAAGVMIVASVTKMAELVGTVPGAGCRNAV